MFDFMVPTAYLCNGAAERKSLPDDAELRVGYILYESLCVSCAQSNTLDDGIDLGIARLRCFEQNLDFLVHVEKSTSPPDLALTETHRKQIFWDTPPDWTDPP